MFLREIIVNKGILSVNGLFNDFECKMKRILIWSRPKNELFGNLVPIV